MTNVKSAAPPAQPIVEEAVEPPTIKNARAMYEPHGSDLVALVVMVALLATLACSMAMAVMTSHGRVARGIVTYATTGAAGLALTIMIILWAVKPHGQMWEITVTVGMLGLAWLVLGVIAFVVGSTVKPTSKRPDVSAF